MSKNMTREDQLDDYYYDAMEFHSGGNLPKAEELLLKALALDENFVGAHVGLVAVNQAAGFFDGVREYTESGYEKTIQHFPRWPKELNWGIIENRQYLRAICYKAALHHIDGEFDDAERLYKLLLKFTPNDNQGVRYLLAGMHAGLSPWDIDALFDEGNAKQNWSKLEQLLANQNGRHRFWQPPHN
jgi:tetratricopeptide (TPR) repeat protein